MNNPIGFRSCRRWPLAACLGLAGAMLGGTMSVPARADDWHGHGNEAHHEAARQHEGDRGRWHDDHHRYDHGDRPDVYYIPPPVVYVPQGYYSQPVYR